MDTEANFPSRFANRYKIIIRLPSSHHFRTKLVERKFLRSLTHSFLTRDELRVTFYYNFFFPFAIQHFL